jgi:hypothetical protein
MESKTRKKLKRNGENFPEDGFQPDLTKNSNCVFDMLRQQNTKMRNGQS